MFFTSLTHMMRTCFHNINMQKTFIRYYPVIAVPKRLYNSFLTASLRHILLFVFANTPATSMHKRKQKARDQPACLLLIDIVLLASCDLPPFFFSYLSLKRPWVHFLVAVSSFSPWKRLRDILFQVGSHALRQFARLRYSTIFPSHPWQNRVSEDSDQVANRIKASL